MARGSKSRQPADAARAQERREQRLARRHREEAARRRAAQRSRLVRGAVAVIAVAAVGVVAFLLLRPDPELAGVERPAYKGRDHVASPAYGAIVPTSGDHPAQAPSCGSFTSPLDTGLAVHALEHGAVVVWYRPDLGDDEREQLSALPDEWGSHVITSPRDGLDAPIVATAWNRLKRFDQVDGDLREFVDTYRRRGPERVDCDVV